jgi:hypothetical protein
VTKGIRVTAIDLETFETGKREIQSGDYCLIVAEPLYLASEQRHANGTVVLTLKRTPTGGDEAK